MFGFLGLLRSCAPRNRHTHTRMTAKEDECREGLATSRRHSLLVFQYDLITLYLWTERGRNQGFSQPSLSLSLRISMHLIETIDDGNTTSE